MEGLEALREQVKTQCSNGNWNYDPYMHGMANGLICALATIENKEPEYLNPPGKWLCNMETDNNTTQKDCDHRAVLEGVEYTVNYVDSETITLTRRL